jgi:predicted lipase
MVNDWHTDFSALPSSDGLHRGFANALDSAWSPIEGAIAARPNTEQALFFTGHSLGGALALIAAERAAHDPAVNARATGVYVFGCPRAGGDAFFSSYTPVWRLHIPPRARLRHRGNRSAGRPVPPGRPTVRLGAAVHVANADVGSRQTTNPRRLNRWRPR